MSIIKDINKRVVVSKIQLSGHNLPAESGRYSNNFNVCVIFANSMKFVTNSTTCPHHEFMKLRVKFVQNITFILVSSNFHSLDMKSIFTYINVNGG